MIYFAVARLWSPAKVKWRGKGGVPRSPGSAFRLLRGTEGPGGLGDSRGSSSGACTGRRRNPPTTNNLEVHMRMVKSLLLGSAAGIVAVAGAQAADLPVKAKPVEYVKICSLYGDGFFYLPGTETCIRLRGSGQADYYYNALRNGHGHGGASNGA